MFKLLQSLHSDIPAITKTHRICFAKSLSSKLGNDYTAKTFEWFLAGENRFLFHVTDNEQVIGYCGGFSSLYAGDGSTSGMMQYAMREAVKGTLKRPWLLFNKEVRSLYPVITKNIFKKFKKSRNNKVEDTANTPAEKKVGLVVIGVLPKFRGEGVFEILMNEFEKQTLLRNIYKIGLSVKKQNERAINAYKKAGWKIEKEHSNSFEMVKYIK